MRLGSGRGPPSPENDPPIDEQQTKTLADKFSLTPLQSQGAPTDLPCEANEAFAWHFEGYVADAGRQSIIDAAETETNSGELLRFAESRFHTLIYGFNDFFFDCWRAIGRPFQEAAKDSIQTGRRE